MPLPWFRRKNNPTDSGALEAPVPVPAPAPPAVAASAAPEADGDPTKPKRRRGNRGGRNRRKPGEAPATSATGEPAEKRTAEKKPTAKAEKPERKNQSQRQQRNGTSGRRRPAPKRAPLPAAKRELLVSVDVGEQRVAVLENDQVAEVYLERPERRSIAGNIYLGTVDNVLPGMEAAFVEVGLEKNGFLYVDEIVREELEGKRHGKKIQDLISRGETILVQAVKDPMKTKGARLTMEISLPGRFVVFVPQGEGLGVSRRLPDDERARLKDVIKGLEIKEGGVIVRTAAEGASAEDIELDLVFLQRLWKSITARAKGAKAPSLIYQEAELPLRVTRDLFTGDFERALVDNDQAYKRIVGYLKKTSPHMVERVIRYKDKEPLMNAFGVDAEIRSTLNKRVDLPSGGYLIFDYAEAFTVVDVNTGRFVGSRSKSSGARLEDTITKNNLEAVKEVVRQLRLRDIGGIIVIDFIDMASPQNRATVEAALSAELERDRTKTYVVEISPLGLVEMTRQNVTDGPREILTRKCPTCAGDGIVVSEATAAVDAERKLRALAAGSRTQSYRVELNGKVLSTLAGPGAERLTEIEAQTKRRFFLQGKEGVHTDHFHLEAEGSIAQLSPKAAVEEGAEVELKLGELDRHDSRAAVGKIEGFDVIVAGAASLVGKKLKVRVTRVLPGIAYAVRLDAPVATEGPLTAEAEAEKPTRAPRARKAAETEAVVETAVETELELETEEDEEELQEVVADAEVEVDEGAEPAVPVKRKTRRGSRGGKNRRPKPATAEGEETPAEDASEPEVDAEAVSAPRIHVPRRELEETSSDDGDETTPGEPSENGDDPVPVKKKTRRGSRGGKNRKKKPPVVATGEAEQNGAGEPEDTPAEELAHVPVEIEEPVAVHVAEPTPEPEATSDEYVPVPWDDL